MAFGQSANRGIAGHAGDGIEETRHKKGIHAHARGNERGLSASMAATYNNDVKLVFHAD